MKYCFKYFTEKCKGIVDEDEQMVCLKCAKKYNWWTGYNVQTKLF